MDVSIYLSRFFGFYLLIISFLHLFQREFLQEAMDDFFASPGLRLISGVFTLILGLLFVLLHDVWELNFRLVVTLLCWVTLIKGVLNLYVPSVSEPLKNTFLKSPAIHIAMLGSQIVGLYLLYSGFHG